jgi:hypothetical protein
MVFCVLAGIGSRVLAIDADRANACPQAAEASCHHDCAGAGQDDHHQDGDKCPPDHHHHFGSCSHALPLSVESEFICRLGVPGSSLSGVRHEGEVPPEEPFLASEKPPLI